MRIEKGHHMRPRGIDERKNGRVVARRDLSDHSETLENASPSMRKWAVGTKVNGGKSFVIVRLRSLRGCCSRRFKRTTRT
jgi:hypothetical protein